MSSDECLEKNNNEDKTEPSVSVAVKLEPSKTLVDVFKGYLDTAITANIAFYGLAGAIVAYYLSNQQGKDYLKYSLLLPLILGLLVVWRSIVGIEQAYKLKRAMLGEKEESDPEKWHNLKILFNKYHPDTNRVPVDVLIGFLRASVFLDFIVFIGLILIFFDYPRAVFTPPK